MLPQPGGYVFPSSSLKVRACMYKGNKTTLINMNERLEDIYIYSYPSGYAYDSISLSTGI